ncbi:MAG TPA: PilZ domain-containing protein [Candidatus Acidoferrales bacterium]|nr:PilZ domain-containing protein [Candidatus Acidoferrales bacterium]
MNTERRQYTRQKLQSPELLEMGAENGGLVVDVGEHGLGFQLVSPIEIGRTVNLAFSLGSNELIRAQARIAWVSAEGKTGGMEFTGVPEFTRKHMQLWLESFSPQPHAAPREEPVPLRPGPFPGAVMRSELGLSLRAAAAAPASAQPLASAPPPDPKPAPAPAIPSAPTVVPALEKAPNPFARPPGSMFSRSPYAAEPSATDASGHKKLAAYTLVGLFLIACLAAAELFPAAPRRVMADIEGIPRAIIGSAKARATPPPENPTPAANAESLGSSKAPAPRPASASVDPFSVAPARPLKKSPSVSALSRAYVRGMPGSTPARSRASERGMPEAAEKKPSATSAKPVPADVQGLGRNEFLRGENYLSGKGTPRDPVQAARWFWAALGDGYTPATIPLADMYLRGEGVSRSCLQARVLLTAAARKKNVDAIRRLAQLPGNCD